MEDRGFTGGLPWILTETQDFSDGWRRLHYLFPNGTRRMVAIQQANDSEEERKRIAESLLRGERRFGH